MNSIFTQFGKASLTTARFISRIILLIAILVTVVQVYRQFTVDKSQNVTFEEILELSQERNQHEIDKLKDEDNIASDVIPIVEASICRISGELCKKLPDDEAYAQSITNTFSDIMLFPIYNPPASSAYSTYVAFENAGLISETYAQSTTPRGIGFTMLQPLSVIWKHIRNISLLLLAIYMIIVGFMIMFRMKLNAQTVISIENSIPRVVLTIILVSFSFAIAGFLIDLMYVIIGLIIGIFAGLNLPDLDTATLLKDYMFADGSTIFSSIFAGHGLWTVFITLPNSIVSILGMRIKLIVQALGSLVVWYWIVGPFIGDFAKSANVEGEGEGVIQAILGLAGKLKATNPLYQGIKITGLIVAIPVIYWLGAFIGKLLIGLFIFITALALSLRIFVVLLKAYTNILISVIFSPFILLAEVFPGKSAFKSWLRYLISEIATFPIVISIFLAGALIFKSGFLVQGCEGFFSDREACQSITFPFFYGLNPESFVMLVGFGFLFITPEWVKYIKKMINPTPPDYPTAGIGTFFGAVTGGSKKGLSLVSATTGTDGIKWIAEKASNRFLPGFISNPIKRVFSKKS